MILLYLNLFALKQKGKCYDQTLVFAVPGETLREQFWRTPPNIPMGRYCI